MRAVVWSAALSLTAMLVMLSETSPAEARTPPVCTGTDLVAEMQAAGDPVIAEAIEAAKAIPNDGAVLWKLEKAGRPASYLFGTMHATDPRLTALSPALENAIRAVDTVALELSGSMDADMARMMAQSPSTFFLTDGTTLADKLSAERLEKLRRATAGTGMSPEPLQPWMASMLLAVSACERRRMAANIPVLDKAIDVRARTLGKTVVALETVEVQVRAMSGIPLADQIPQLQFAIDLYERADDLAETLTRLYLDRRIGLVWTMNLAMAKARGIPEERFKAFEDTLIDARNRGMAEKGFALMESGPVLIAVGALHLVGDTGLVALAREAGFTATAIE